MDTVIAGAQSQTWRYVMNDIQTLRARPTLRGSRGTNLTGINDFPPFGQGISKGDILDITTAIKRKIVTRAEVLERYHLCEEVLEAWLGTRRGVPVPPPEMLPLYTFGDLLIDTINKKVEVAGVDAGLVETHGDSMFRILVYLARYGEKFVTQKMIYEYLYASVGSDALPHEKIIHAWVARIRKQLTLVSDKIYLTTIRGLGVMLHSPR